MSDHFSADEARRIFSRAARRQHVASPADGLSASELESIARDAGLDPDLVLAEAAAERIGQEMQQTWHGVPVGLRRSRMLLTRVSDLEWEQIVDLLRAEYKTPGMAEQIGRRREWSAVSGTSSSVSQTLIVRVEERAEGDLVTIEAPDISRRLGIVLGASFATMAVLISAMIAFLNPEKLSAAAGLLVFLALAATVSYGGFFVSAKLSAARTPDRLEGLLDRIDLISRQTPPISESPSGRIDPVHLGAEAGALDTNSPARRRTRS